MCPSGTAASLSAATTSNLQRAFDVIDTDRDGLISRHDLRSFFSSAYHHHHHHDDELIAAMISLADSDGDGFVEFTEFHRMISNIERGRKNGEIRGSSSGAGAHVMEEAFRLMDTDADGRLSHGDLKRFLSSSGLDASDEDVTGMMRLACGDHPAAPGVSFHDFLRILAICE